MPIDFSVEPVDEKPRKKGGGRKGSSYAPILDSFLKSGHKLVRVDNTGKEANNLALNLNRVIKKRGYSIKVSVRNREVYLEKSEIT